METFFSATG